MSAARAALRRLLGSPETIHAVYDTRCAFCRRAAAALRACDLLGAYRFHDTWDRALVAARFPMIPAADLDDAMYAVAERGRVFRGFFAFRRMVWSSPLTWPLLPLFYFPGASLLGPRVYDRIARNRHRFGCESEACALLPAAEQDPGARGRGAR